MSEDYLEENTQNKAEDLFYDYKLGAKPFLKWVGGKRQLIEQLRNLYPNELIENKIQNYYEPFVGGGAVFFDIVQNYEVQNAYLYDINDELILTYLVIQQDVYKLIEFLHKFERTYKQLSEKNQKKYYYELRESYNLQRFNIDYEKYSDNWIPRAAQTIFLNKTCFNGLARFNSSGAFNTPMGKYSNPKILDETNLLHVSKVLEIATIKKADFKQVKHDIKNNSFVYFDPPYRPISHTSSFTSYSKYNFEDDEQLQLAALFIDLDKEGHKLMLSNSDPKNTDQQDDFFDYIYAKFKITRVAARRSINSNPSRRKAINEIVVTNY